MVPTEPNSVPQVWQVSSGPANRSFAELFLRHAVALVGPGDSGPWRASGSDDQYGGYFVRRFANEVRHGDVMLLRMGLSTIGAVGLVEGDYQFLPQFDDVNGWDLQHARRVRWFELPDPYDFGSSVFGGLPFSLSHVSHPDVIRYAMGVVNSPLDRWKHQPLPPLPAEQPVMENVPSFLLPLLARVNDLQPLYERPSVFGEPPAEDELIVHYVVPLLQALGWSVERIAVQWRKIDVALFRTLPRSPQTCHLVIEAKRLGSGVEGALEQAQGYVRELGRPVDILVTDGIRYRMYAASQDFAPVAYANLARLKQPALSLFERLRRP